MNYYECTCKRCGHAWTSRTEDPKQCPDCKSQRWDSEREIRGQANRKWVKLPGAKWERK